MTLRLTIGIVLITCVTSPSGPPDRFDPDGLLLTWQRDPTSTMTIQWMEPGTLLPLAEGHEAVVAPYSIGHIASDWGPSLLQALWTEGLALDFLANANHQRYEPSVFSATARLGWNDQGVILGFSVRQKDHRESGDATRLWAGSSVEVILVDPAVPETIVRISIAPGLDGNRKRPEVHVDSPDGVAARILPEVVRTNAGYTLVTVVPWEFLPKFDPVEGNELQAQVYVNNRDDSTNRRLAWFPSDLAGVDARFTHRLRLEKVSSPSVPARADVVVQDAAAVCSVFALPEKAGETIAVRLDGHTLASGVLKPSEDHVSKTALSFPRPSLGSRLGKLEIQIGEDHRWEIAPALTEQDYLSPQPVVLEYGSPGGIKNQAKIQPVRLRNWPGVFLQRIELTGLDPDTVYEFCPAGKTRPLRFRTMPTRLQRPLRIALGGDTMQRKEWMEKTTRVAVEQDPDFVIWGGDLADANGLPDALYRWRHWFDTVSDMLVLKDGRVLPVVAAVGNHDVQKGYCHNHEGYQPTDAWRERIAGQFYEFLAFPGHPGYGVLDFGDYLSVVILDSGHTNPIAGTQTEWLESTLRERREVPHVLPVYHVPAYPSTKDYHGKTESEVRQHWPPLFDTYAIRSAFENHNHAYKRTHPLTAEKVQPGGTVYFGDGSWGVRPREVHPAATTWYLQTSAAARYALILTLNGNQQHFTAITDEGVVLDECVIP